MGGFRYEKFDICMLEVVAAAVEADDAVLGGRADTDASAGGPSPVFRPFWTRARVSPRLHQVPAVKTEATFLALSPFLNLVMWRTCWTCG